MEIRIDKCGDGIEIRLIGKNGLGKVYPRIYANDSGNKDEFSISMIEGKFDCGTPCPRIVIYDDHYLIGNEFTSTKGR